MLWGTHSSQGANLTRNAAYAPSRKGVKGACGYTCRAEQGIWAHAARCAGGRGQPHARGRRSRRGARARRETRQSGRAAAYPSKLLLGPRLGDFRGAAACSFRRARVRPLMLSHGTADRSGRSRRRGQTPWWQPAACRWPTACPCPYAPSVLGARGRTRGPSRPRLQGKARPGPRRPRTGRSGRSR